MPLVAWNSRWEETRFSSHMSIRIQVARGGTSSPRSCSTAMEKASSENSGAA
jgi:hypothetical protein